MEVRRRITNEQKLQDKLNRKEQNLDVAKAQLAALLAAGNDMKTVLIEWREVYGKDPKAEAALAAWKQVVR
jgi:hypothetical protein